MLSNKNIAKLRSYENRLENEHNDPEPTDFEECRHCDNLTEPNPKEGKECGECYNPYGLDEDATHEYHQNQIGDLEKRVTYLEKLLRPINLIPAHVLETMTPLEKLAASGRRKGGWCAYCGEYPPVQGFLSCENCIEREPEEAPQ